MMKKKVTKEIKKRGEATEISWPIPHKKLRRRNEKRLKGRFSSKSVDFFTNIFTNRNNDSQSAETSKKRKPALVDVVEEGDGKEDRIGMFLYYMLSCVLIVNIKNINI